MFIYLITTFILFINQGVGDVNVALHKKVTDCLSNELPTLVDGRTDASASIKSSCGNRHAHLNIDIGGPYFVHYVNLIAEESSSELFDTYEITFLVQFLDGSVCGRYHEKSPTLFTFRVNCMDVDNVSSTILVFLENVLIQLTEIEIFTTASGIPNEDIMIYHGCYKDFNIKINHGNSNLKDCERLCRVDRFLLAAIERTNCHCGSDINDDLRDIDIHCTPGCYDKDCVNDKFYSVYILQVRLPHKYSCSDHPMSLLPNMANKKTVQECLKHCDNNKLAFMMTVKSPTIRCSCSNETHGTLETHRGCRHKTRNYVIYATCFDGTSKKSTCSNLFTHCKHGWNEYGDCEGGCKKGFDGKRCLLKIPTACDSGPCPRGSSLCTVENVEGEKEFVCVCHKGYIKLNETVCLNETLYCNNNSCHNESSTCTRTSNGTYQCICKPGFVYKSDTMCVKEIITTTSQVTVTAIIGEAINIVVPKVLRGVTDRNYSSSILEDKFCSNEHKCTTPLAKCQITNSIGRCICVEGFWWNKLKTYCIDIDECIYGPCNLDRSGCKNHEGRFECVCKKGYVKISHDFCLINITKTSSTSVDFSLLIPILLIFLIMIVGGFLFVTVKLFISKSQ